MNSDGTRHQISGVGSGQRTKVRLKGHAAKLQADAKQ